MAKDTLGPGGAQWHGGGLKRFFFLRIVAAVLGAAFITGCILLIVMFAKRGGGASRKDALAEWNAGKYDAVYKLSSEKLETTPMDDFYLVLNGFSAYELAIAQVGNDAKQNYLNTGLWSLRRAILVDKNALLPAGKASVYYVLGKIYFYKGPYWQDLAVKYLKLAQADGCKNADLSEYLGLAFAGIHQYDKASAEFARLLAATPAPSDKLLMAIARAEIDAGNYDKAEDYLNKAIAATKDSTAACQAALLLGDIAVKENKPDLAAQRYQATLDTYGENARAHYCLGELYQARGDTVKARAEWRRALRIDSTFMPARARLSG
jgi:tetratricopeptide (TPR) repeat protein